MKFLQFSKKIAKKGGLGEFDVVDLLEWFMKSMIEMHSAIDQVLKERDSQEWPRLQTLKQLFVDLVKPMEKMVAHLYPLPPYQEMR